MLTTDISGSSGRDRAAAGRGGAAVRPASKHALAAAFSLIEVTLAVGIMGFAFVAILGLVPLGLTTFRETKHAGVSAQISQRIFSEVQATPFSSLTQVTGNPSTTTVTNPQGGSSQALRLPAPPESQGAPIAYTRYFNDEGSEVLSADPTGIYQSNVRVLIAPPFVQTGTASSVTNADAASVTIQIAYNPARATLDLDATDLLKGTSGTLRVPLYTFVTYVARNF